MSSTPIPTSTLLKAISDSDTTLMFSEVVAFPATGASVLIGTEQIDYTANVNGTLYGCTRGANSTVAATHAIGSTIALISLFAAPTATVPNPLPAVSGANLTNLNASALASGTVPDARFPAVLPAVSGANLTNLPSPGFKHVFTAALDSYTGLSGIDPTLSTFAAYTIPVFSFANGTGPDVRYLTRIVRYNGGQLKVDLTFCPGNTGTGTIDWTINTQCVRQVGLDDYAANYSAGNTGTTTVVNAYRKKYTQTVTLTGITCLEGDDISINVQRSASDTYGNEAWLSTVTLYEG